MNAHTRVSCLAALLTLLVLVASGLRPLAATPRALTMPALNPRADHTVAAVAAQPLAATVGGTWIPQGPAPALNGQQSLAYIPPSQSPVVGSLGGGPYSNNYNVMAASPTDANTIYIGSDGGAWKTTNALAASPTWTPLLDTLPPATPPLSLNIRALAADPTDATFNTVLLGSDRSGLYYTTNGGTSWTQFVNPLLVPSGYTAGYKAVAARGNTLLATGDNGLFRSTDRGVNWAKISGTGGLPTAKADALVGDPLNPDVLYVTFLGASGGIFRSDNLGSTWTNINVNGGINLISSATDFFRLAVFHTSATSVVTAILNGTEAGATVKAMFRSVDGAAFTPLDVPLSMKALSADKTNPNLVYTSGYGTTDVYRVDASRPSGAQITNIAVAVSTTLSAARTATDTTITVGSVTNFPTTVPYIVTVDTEQLRVTSVSGTTLTVERGVNGTTAAAHRSGALVTAETSYGYPHADYVAFTYDANGSLLAGSHGGIYRLPAPGSPASPSNYWVSIMGDIGAYYFWDLSYDHLSHVILGASQDNGDAHQTAPNSQVWTKALSGDGDGSATLIDNGTLAAQNQSVRYQGDKRFIFDANNVQIGSFTTFSTSVIVKSGAYGRRTLNVIDPRRIIFPATENIYESLDKGETIASIAAVGVDSGTYVYGGYRNGVANPEVLYFGKGNLVYARTTAGGAITPVSALPTGTSTINGVAVDPADWMTLFVVDRNNQVAMSADGGSTWSNITGNLKAISVSTPSLAVSIGGGIKNTIAVVPGPAGYLVVGAGSGAYTAPLASLGTNTVWSSLGTNLPPVPVPQLIYDATDDVLVAGTIGRGAYTLPNARAQFNAGPTVALSGPATANEGSTHTYTFTVSDANAGDTFTVDSLTVSAGGTLVPGSLTTTATGGSFQVRSLDGPASPTISLRVKDSYDALSTTATRAVTVANVAPTAAILGAPTSGAVGTPIPLGSAVTDPGTADTSAGFTLAWSVTKNGSPFASGSGASFSFTPNAAATYVVTLSATDTDGATRSAAATIATGASTLTENSFSVAVNEGQTATNSGTFRNVNGNPLTLSPSIGTLTMVPSPIHFFSGNGNTSDTGTPGGAAGTINGGVTFTTGQVGQAFSFPGSGGAASSTPNVTYPASDFAPGTSDFSVAFGLQTSYILPVGRPEVVLGNRRAASHGNFFGVRINTNGTLVVELDQTTTEGDDADINYIPLGTTVAINDGLFHHIVVTRQGTAVKLYLDGSLNSSGTTAAPTNITGALPFQLGAEQGRAATFTSAFNGLLDEVRIYNQALSPATITQDYNAFVAGNAAPYGTWSWSYTTDDGAGQPQDVTITATDTSNGQVTSLPFRLVVTNVAPTASFANGGAVSEGSAGSVAFSGQSDPSTVDTTAGFHYAYDFDNDGRFESGDGTYAGSGTAASATVPASLLADGPGTRTVRGRIIDKDNGVTDYTTTITITTAAPVASVSGPASALATQSVTFVVGATDPSSVDQAAGFSYRITWGDGTSVKRISRSDGNGAATATHAYAATGSYTVQVTATDKDGAASAAPATTTIQVNPLTTATAQGPATTALVVYHTASSPSTQLSSPAASSLQDLIATTDFVYLAATDDAALHTIVAAINGLSAPAAPVGITILLGDGPYTGVTLSPPDNIVLDLAGNHTADTPGTQISSTSGPAITVTSGEVFVQGDTLTTAADSPTILVSGGHVTLGEDALQESTGANNVAINLTGGSLTIGLEMLLNINGTGSFFQTYDPDAISFPDGIDADLAPTIYQVNGTTVSATRLSATDLESSANPSVFGDPVTFTAGIDAEADEFGEATGTVTFYDGATVLGVGTVQEVGPDEFEASFTTAALSVGTHTIRAIYGGDEVYVSSAAQLTQQINPYPFAGFFQPVDNPPTFNRVTAGASIPFKFSLSGNRGLSIIAAGYPTSQHIQCDSGAPIDDIEQTTTSPSGLIYDASSGQYTYTWKTVSSWAGTCRQFTLRLADGTNHLARFTFK